jgi:hypothetical protein
VISKNQCNGSKLWLENEDQMNMHGAGKIIYCLYLDFVQPEKATKNL